MERFFNRFKKPEEKNRRRRNGLGYKNSGEVTFYELLSSRYFIQVFHGHKHVRQVLPSQCGTSGDLEYYYPMLMNGLGFRRVPLQFIASYLNRSGKVRHYDGYV